MTFRTWAPQLGIVKEPITASLGEILARFIPLAEYLNGGSHEALFVVITHRHYPYEHLFLSILLQFKPI